MAIEELFFIFDFLECQMLILLIGLISFCSFQFKRLRKDLCIFLIPVVITFISIIIEHIMNK
jgi:hypothetical protein